MTSTRMSRARKVDAATPKTRNRVVDFLRAAAITVVVLGHWTIIAVDADGGIPAPTRPPRDPHLHPQMRRASIGLRYGNPYDPGFIRSNRYKAV